MSRQVKLDDEIYDELCRLKSPGETFSLVIKGLLDARLKIFEFINILEGQVKYREWQHEQLQKITRSH